MVTNEEKNSKNLRVVKKLEAVQLGFLMVALSISSWALVRFLHHEQLPGHPVSIRAAQLLTDSVEKHLLMAQRHFESPAHREALQWFEQNKKDHIRILEELEEIKNLVIQNGGD